MIAVAHPKWAERPLACVVLKPGQTLTPEALQTFLLTKFARWQLPDAVEFIEAIPRTSTGKFWKARPARALRSLVLARGPGWRTKIVR